MAIDWQPVWLTLKPATLILLIIGTPIAWWLSRSRCFCRDWVGAIVALPSVLPPTVLGFYLLLILGPQGIVGRTTAALGLGTLPFTFTGLVVGSVLYSMPFVVQPVRHAFETMGPRPMEVATTLRASPTRAFFPFALPQARPCFLTGGVLGFAHMVGEFGVVLMIGGNIPGETKVLMTARPCRRASPGAGGHSSQAREIWAIEP